MKRSPLPALIAGLLLFSGVAQAQVEVLSPSADVKTAALEAAKLDVLVYNDGDRVRGHLVERSVDSWLFMSERFGVLRVPLADAHVVLSTPEAAEAIARANAEAAQVRLEEAQNASFLARLSPAALAQDLKDFFGPWHGRFALSTQLRSASTDTTTTTLDAHLQRKWAKDDLQLNTRYDFAEANHVTTTDVIKGEAAWRHDFPDKLFSIYSPSVELNRASSYLGLPNDYFLLQQEFGVGVNIFAKPTRNVRLGLAENVFDVWQLTEPRIHEQNNAESMFLEADWQLPWRMKVTERGVWYHTFASGQNGFENKIELDKKLTETFIVGLRHETRQNNPDVRIQDYTLLKLLLGIDF
jgi:hypothetical protein